MQQSDIVLMGSLVEGTMVAKFMANEGSFSTRTVPTRGGARHYAIVRRITLCEGFSPHSPLIHATAQS